MIISSFLKSGLFNLICIDLYLYKISVKKRQDLVNLKNNHAIFHLLLGLLLLNLKPINNAIVSTGNAAGAVNEDEEAEGNE